MRRDGHDRRVVTLKLKTADFKLRTAAGRWRCRRRHAKTLFAYGASCSKGELGPAYRLIGSGLSDLHEASAPDDFFGAGEARAVRPSRPRPPAVTVRGRRRGQRASAQG